MKCVHCGTMLRNESNYCLGCGRPVDALECYVAEMRESGRALTRKTDKESLEHIIDLTGKIFERTKLNPDLKYEVRAFFESYLPKITEVLNGYRGVSGQKELKGRMGEVKDDCIAFDPVAMRELEDRERDAGRIGLRLVFGMAKDVQYQNILGLNILTIRI